MDDRRTFFQKMMALAVVPASGAAAIRRPPFPAPPPGRAQEALQLRENAAAYQAGQAVASYPTNGDETSLPAYIGSFTKGLPHTQLGEVQPGTYETLLHALSTGSQADFENIARGSGSKFVSPLAAFAYQMEGADSHRLGMDAPPAFSTPDAAGEMVELYWQALARDVPFTAYATSTVTQAAMADLNRLSAFHGPKNVGQVASSTLFRGNVVGGLIGPYISQFFWQPVPVNSTVVHQLFRAGAAGIDYLNSWDEWLVLQQGVPPFRAWTPDPVGKYIYNGRSLAEWVHFDFLYQAFHTAGLILLNQSPDSVLNTNPYLNPTNPYKSTKVETGFVTFGAAHICCLLGTVTESALMAAWFQKWLVHRRTRPEAFGGRVHQTKLGLTKYPIHAELMNSEALKTVFAANGNYLLPQAYPEGCPLHPSYPSGHATVAGACSAMLKAFFDETQILTNCVVAGADGTSLSPYPDTALTVGGEINKLAFNVAMGRDFAGIHYRSDAEAGIRLGEDVAIAMLQDVANTFAEDFTGFRFTRVDGTPVQVSPVTARS
jgi:membrane-associated phospholipid phosphatase